MLVEMLLYYATLQGSYEIQTPTKAPSTHILILHSFYSTKEFDDSWLWLPA